MAVYIFQLLQGDVMRNIILILSVLIGLTLIVVGFTLPVKAETVTPTDSPTETVTPTPTPSETPMPTSTENDLSTKLDYIFYSIWFFIGLFVVYIFFKVVRF